MTPHSSDRSDAELEALLARAAEQGAKRALADFGLDDNEAALDIRDLRSLVTVSDWCAAPRCRRQNAYVERYNRTVRHEWLDLYIFETIAQAQSTATDWLWTYNNERPNMGIGGITPAQKLKMAA